MRLAKDDMSDDDSEDIVSEVRIAHWRAFFRQAESGLCTKNVFRPMNINPGKKEEGND